MKRLGRRALCGALTLFLLSMGGKAPAHDRGTSYSNWRIRGSEATVTLRIADLEITRFPWASDDEATHGATAARYFADQVQLWSGDRPCAVIDAARRIAGVDGQRAYEWRVACPAATAMRIRSRALLDVSPGHLHFARARRDDRVLGERVLSERGDTWEIGDGSTAPVVTGSLFDYVALGVEHILSGYDHLAFVAALLLLAGSLGEVARIVTGFTIAHSLTLALMALGYVQPAAAPIEALIGLSIALVAAENTWQLDRRESAIPAAIAAALAIATTAAAFGYGSVPATTLAGLALFGLCYFELLRRVARPLRLRWGIAFLFGLIHGFGFASVLGDAGLPADRLTSALLGFNLGVEFGQLLVALVYPLLAGLRMHAAATHRTFVEASSAAVFGLGLYWFVLRTYG